MSEPQNIEPALLSINDTARFLNVSTRKISSMDSAGLLPLSIKAFGRRKLWSREELSEWIRYGAVSRERWEQIKLSEKEKK